jgi:SAM-dependent methyltransferase
MPAPLCSNWYDLPRYYDLSVADETEGELAFVEGAAAKFLKPSPPQKPRRVVEPACGTGRLTEALAKQGFHVTAFDLNPTMVEFTKQRLHKNQLKAGAGDGNPRLKSGRLRSTSVFAADMAHFTIPQPADIGVCLLDSFRHLLTEDDARAHLQCMANAVLPGGIYLLGLHLLPPDADLDCTERWTNQAGSTHITTTLRVTESSRRTRLEQIRISLLVRDGKRIERYRDEFSLRLYTAAQLKSLVASVPEWSLEAVYDYWYELDSPLKLTNELSDTVLVLRRK